MQELPACQTGGVTTPTTTQPFGPSTAESRSPPGPLPGDPYAAICRDLEALLARKRGYYGCSSNPLENAMGVAEDGVVPWVYQLARIGEKRRRLKGNLRTLDIVKTFMDIAGHAVVAIACIQAEESARRRAENESPGNEVALGQPVCRVLGP